ncbi:MAG: cation:proton antiporter [Planctomycetota bacterium]
MPNLLENLSFNDPLFNLATVLIAGIVGGEIFALLKMPKVTGWIATGITLRALKLPGMNYDDLATLNDFTPLMHFVLGFIAFTVGATLYFASLRNTSKRIGLLLLCEAIITPLMVFVLMYMFGPYLTAKYEIGWQAALLFGVIAVAGAPGTTVLVVQEARARGTLTKTLIAAIGLIDMVAVGVFVFASAAMATDATWTNAAMMVGFQFLTTFIIGSLCAVIALALIRFVVSPAFVGPTMVAVILGSWGAASAFGTSGGILACTFAGIAVTNIRHDIVRSTEAYLNAIGGVLFACFFTLAGMRLDFSLVPTALGLVLLYFVARFSAKYIGAFTAMSLAGMTTSVRNYLGLALLPHGGVAVGLILLVQSAEHLQDYQSLITTVGLSALAINQLLGPSAARFALIWAGEDHKDRPQLLDFLQEHRINVDLNGESKEDVIKTLASNLYATYDMEISQEDFVQQVLQRETDETTCLGQGLMIPHAILDEGAEVRGVLGISTRGLDLGAPDGRLIHAVLLLATPKTERDRHLEVLAAFASAITRDVNFAEQLYHARSAAHAYDVLHHEDQEDLNYFLEDAAERAGLRAEEVNPPAAEDDSD